MRFIISFFLTFPVYAAPIRIFHEAIAERAHIVRSIFTVEYQIPEELIVVNRVEECEEIKGRGKLDMCLKNNGDLLVVSVDYEFINESLKIFRAP